MKKKFIGAIIAVMAMPVFASAATIEELQAQINALLAQIAAMSNTTTQNTTSCGSFSTPLSLGMTSVDVLNLQRALNSDPYTQVAAYGSGSIGNETMYFGPATKLAVSRFQQKYAAEVLHPQGLSTPTGEAGYLTLAKLNSLCKVTQNTNTNTGANTTTSNTTTGTNTNTNTNSNNTDLNGGAGTLSVNSYSSDVEDMITTGSTETVLSFKARADGSDVRMSHMRIELSKVDSNGSSYPNRYFDSFDIYANDTRVGSIDVSDLNRDSSGEYSITARLNDAIIRMGSSKQVVFKVKANAVDSIDSDNAGKTWKMVVSDFRYTDATGATLFENSSITDNSFYVDKLSTSGDVKVKISTGSSNPDERTVFVSDDTSGDKVTMNEFKIRAEGTKVLFDTVRVRYDVSGVTTVLADKVTEIQFVRGDEILDTVDPTVSSENDTTNKILTFNLDDQEYINQDETITYRIVARMKKIGTATFANGDSLSISVESASSLKPINAEDRVGDTISTSRFSGSSSGKIQTFRNTGISLTRSSSYAESVPRADTAPGYGKYSMTLRITASGDDLWVPLTSSASASTTAGIVYELPAGTSTAVVTRVSGGSTDGNFVKIADGETALVRINVSFDPTSNGFAKMRVKSVNYTLNQSIYSEITATPTTDFETDSIDIRK